ncbi:MAG: type II secretion system protein [Planctomycetota bacterium]|jgi:prepilin-type N-terminal cleavage/methylation domain-containing protein/prepilin-type processing-associated H-X9-DG protein
MVYPNKEKAFTLIELLVVISIIALLLSILVPSLSKAKERAQFVLCGSRIKQLVLAEALYTGENDGRYSNGMITFSLPYNAAVPQITDRSMSGDDADCRWHDEKYNNDNRHDLWGQIWPYLENQEVVLCPVFKKLANKVGQFHSGSHNPDIPVEPQYSYSKNIWLGNPSTYYDGIWPWASEYEAPKETNVKSPTTVFMFAEENTWTTNMDGYTQLEGTTLNWNGASINDNALFSIWQGPQTGVDCFATYHKTSWGSGEEMMAGVSNAVFADGHLETVLNYATTGSNYRDYISEPRNCIRRSDPKGWYKKVYRSGP